MYGSRKPPQNHINREQLFDFYVFIDSSILIDCSIFGLMATSFMHNGIPVCTIVAALHYQMQRVSS